MGIYEGDEARMVDAAVAEEHAARAGLRVDAENVLYVRKAILEEIDLLRITLDREGEGLDRYKYRYGDDPVSTDAAIAFSQRTAILIGQCDDHVNELLAIANNLKLAAEAYGKTDEEIAAHTPLEQRSYFAEGTAMIRSMFRPWEWA